MRTAAAPPAAFVLIHDSANPRLGESDSSPRPESLSGIIALIFKKHSLTRAFLTRREDPKHRRSSAFIRG
jgi:hypothetical protein